MRTRTGCLTTALITTSAIAAAATAATAAPNPAATPLSQVRSVYREVLTAEYFGPASGVCSHLTASGLKSYEAGGAKSCAAAFSANQHILTHKMPGVDDSGYTPAQWRGEVTLVMSHLHVTLKGDHASVIGGQSGIPGRTTLVETGGVWRFSSYPPSVSS